MNKYEVLYVIDAAMEDQARSELIAQFSELMTNNGATVEKVDEWGKRRLAYPINFKNEGYYVLVNFTAAPEFPRELERNFEINENIMRYLVTRVEE
ncbi:MAG: 30S ribosomal protein S6 [Candidatus Spyradocola sp.]